MARPQKPIKPMDENTIKQLAAIGCTWDEMLSITGLSRKTLTRRYGHAIEEGRNSGKMSLRRKRYEVAMQGNVPMLIWLSKQILEESDKTSSHDKSEVVVVETLKTKCEELEKLAQEKNVWGDEE